MPQHTEEERRKNRGVGAGERLPGRRPGPALAAAGAGAAEIARPKGRFPGGFRPREYEAVRREDRPTFEPVRRETGVPAAVTRTAGAAERPERPVGRAVPIPGVTEDIVPGRRKPTFGAKETKPTAGPARREVPVITIKGRKGAMSRDLTEAEKAQARRAMARLGAREAAGREARAKAALEREAAAAPQPPTPPARTGNVTQDLINMGVHNRKVAAYNRQKRFAEKAAEEARRFYVQEAREGAEAASRIRLREAQARGVGAPTGLTSRQIAEREAIEARGRALDYFGFEPETPEAQERIRGITPEFFLGRSAEARRRRPTEEEEAGSEYTQYISTR